MSNTPSPSLTGMYSAATTGHTGFFSEIEELRQSHKRLQNQMQELAEEFRAYKAAAQAPQHCAGHTDRLSCDAHAAYRTAAFASVAVSKALLTSSIELSKVHNHLCAATSVRQIVVKSKAIDCTLKEFRLFAAACSRNPRIRSDLFPSEH